jgi:hypothetical protein
MIRDINMVWPDIRKYVLKTRNTASVGPPRSDPPGSSGSVHMPCDEEKENAEN